MIIPCPTATIVGRAFGRRVQRRFVVAARWYRFIVFIASVWMVGWCATHGGAHSVAWAMGLSMMFTLSRRPTR